MFRDNISNGRIVPRRLPEKEFTIEKLSCVSPTQLLRILVPLKSVSPAHVKMTVLQITSEFNPNLCAYS